MRSGLEQIALRRAESLDPGDQSDAAWLLADGADTPTPTAVIVLVPAHNEEEQIAAAIDSLLAQTIPVEIVVCADNCTDETVAIAKSTPSAKRSCS